MKLGAYSLTPMCRRAGTNKQTARACPSFKVAAPSRLTNVCSTAAWSGAYSCTTSSKPSSNCKSRSARDKEASERTAPLPIWVSLLPCISTIPQPVNRRPGSNPIRRLFAALTCFPFCLKPKVVAAPLPKCRNWHRHSGRHLHRPALRPALLLFRLLRRLRQYHFARAR